MREPKAWSDITVKQLILSSDIEQDTDMDYIEKMAMTVSIMYEIPLIEVNKMLLKDVRNLNAKLEFMNTPPSNQFVNDFEIDGVKYIVNPDITALTFEQFQAFDYFTKDKTMIVKNTHNLMAIICLPEGEQYDMSKAGERAMLFYNRLTLDVVTPVSSFFLNLYEQLQVSILHSLESKIDKSQREMNRLIQELREEV